VLDFGAGSAPYRELFSNAEAYITVDIEVSGHEGEDKVADHFYNGRVLPFPSESFDAIFSSEVFEHIFNLPEILRDLHRVLKPNGQMLITAPFVWEEHEAPYDFARYTSFGLVHLLTEAGFVVEEQVKTTGYIETIFQMVSVYLLQNSPLHSGILRQLGIFLISAPINALGIILNSLMPRDERLFHNLVITCRRSSVPASTSNALG
jgi:ubiquinone/menaquinone biosynthesis C-methylase UbiE